MEDKKIKVLCTLSMLELTIEHSLTPIINIDKIDEIHVVRTTPGPPLNKVFYHSFPKYFSFLSPVTLFIKLILLLYLSIRLKPDIIISYYMKFSGVITFIAGKILSIPINMNVMSGPQEFQEFRVLGKDYKIRVMEILLLTMLKKFDSITTTGTKTIKYLTDNGVDPKKVRVLPDAVDMEKFIIKSKGGEKYDLIIVARFDPIKRIDNFIKIVNNVKVHFPTIKAVIVGDGPLRGSLTEKVNMLDLNENIYFAGYTLDVHKYYTDSKICISTSEREGLPMTILEAMGTGLPCVVSNVGNINDLIIDGKNSFIIDDFNDLDGYRDKIIQLLNDQKMYDKISKNASSDVRLNYSYENAKSVWRSIFKSTIY